jgi:hypothetical protein
VLEPSWQQNPPKRSSSEQLFKVFPSVVCHYTINTSVQPSSVEGHYITNYGCSALFCGVSLHHQHEYSALFWGSHYITNFTCSALYHGGPLHHQHEGSALFCGGRYITNYAWSALFQGGPPRHQLRVFNPPPWRATTPPTRMFSPLP